MNSPSLSTSPPSSGHHFHPSIIREYDMRGIVGDTLHAADAKAIGQTYASMVRDAVGHAPRIAVARDGRHSSPELHAALVEGMIATGACVLDVGIGPTPMLYFSVYHLEADAGVMVTGSHNPPTHNGFKLMLGKQSFFGEQIRALADRAAAADWSAGQGSIDTHDVRTAYLDAMLAAIRLPETCSLNLVFDAGNGAAGEICSMLVERLAVQGHEMCLLFGEIDGNFPNHHPDPSVVANLRDLQAEVVRRNAQLGLAFDGDGDRLGAVDDRGRPVSSDHLLMLLSQQVLAESPGATIIADVKSSQSVFDAIAVAGGQPMMWKTGHSHIKTRLKQVKAAFAGEASGHVFFADRYYGFDDGIYAALRLIELSARLDEPLSAVIDRLPTPYSTPELRIDCAETRKFVVIDEIRARLDQADAAYIALDGVRCQRPEGWWLVRASNTQAAIIARAESQTPEGLAVVEAQLREQLVQSGVSLDAVASGH